jgi:SAM-dependent methyltransferase
MVNIDSSLNAWLAQHPRLRWLAYRLGLLPEAQYRIVWPRNIVIHDVRRGLPFADESAQYIYASHFLEHLYYQEAIIFLKECYRVLANGGVLRIVVPDLQSMVESYLKERQQVPDSPEPAERLLDGLGFIPQRPARGVIGFIAFLQDKNRHKWMYDWPSLTALIRGAGFNKFRRCRYLESVIEDIAAVEKEDRLIDALCLECIK